MNGQKLLGAKFFLSKPAILDCSFLRYHEVFGKKRICMKAKENAENYERDEG